MQRGLFLATPWQIGSFPDGRFGCLLSALIDTIGTLISSQERRDGLNLLRAACPSRKASSSSTCKEISHCIISMH